VSTYLALTFSTLLSSQGTIASFETVSPVSPGASVRCSTTLSDLFPLSESLFSAWHAKADPGFGSSD
ncbi:hypothetical protein ACWC5C_40640, partial [Streptomyces sp. NPDC001700]|uniref:hypothetical protein n=1 Tax=Streptomyces sp. NPDC059850 TaxID=3346970 RepID=UPI00366178A6